MPWKAFAPMLVTESPMDTYDTSVQPAKAASSMPTTGTLLM